MTKCDVKILKQLKEDQRDRWQVGRQVGVKVDRYVSGWLDG